MANKFDFERATDVLAFGRAVAEHTPGATDLPPETKAFFLDADGTVDITNPDGSTVEGIPLKAGIPAPFVPARITAIDTATKVYLVK